MQQHNNQRITEIDLATVAATFVAAGRELAIAHPDDRRRLIATMVSAIGTHCPEAVADLAGCASLALLKVGAK